MKLMLLTQRAVSVAERLVHTIFAAFLPFGAAKYCSEDVLVTTT